MNDLYYKIERIKKCLKFVCFQIVLPTDIYNYIVETFELEDPDDYILMGVNCYGNIYFEYVRDYFGNVDFILEYDSEYRKIDNKIWDKIEEVVINKCKDRLITDIKYKEKELKSAKERLIDAKNKFDKFLKEEF